jgi:hypothetical protein
MSRILKASDVDYSLVEMHLEKSYVPEDASTIAEALVDSMIDAIEIFMACDPGNLQAELDSMDCWVSQVRHYGLQDDVPLMRILEDVFLDISIEAGVREMEGLDPDQFL